MSNCWIDIDIDGEECELYDETWPVARKDYKCCECGIIINKGKKHQYVSGKWSGDFCSFRTCLGCARLRSEVCAFFESLNERVFEIYGVNIREPKS